MGPAQMGPVASANSDPGLSEARDKFLTRCVEKGTRCAMGGARSNLQSPSPRFARLGS
jgi:hypothetical protein